MEKLFIFLISLPLLIVSDNGLTNCEMPISFPLPIDAEWYITSDFGYRIHPIKKKRKKHKGIDIAADYGTYVLATGCGWVKKIDQERNYGNMIIIGHSEEFTTIYGHLSEGYVREGDCIKLGDTIGRVGSTGMSTGNHLHYEVRKYGKAVDPEPYLFLINDF